MSGRPSTDAPFRSILAGRRLIALTADPALAAYLHDACGARSLVLSPPSAVDRMRATGAEVLAFDGPHQLSRTDTDVLVLDSNVGRLAGLRFHDLARASHVAVVRRRPRPSAAATRIRQDRWRGRMDSLGQERVVFGSQSAAVDVFSVLNRTTGGARRWFSPALGVDGLLRRLTSAGVRHVVLRWFEDLPALPPGEDLDLLIDDEDLAKVDAILAEAPGTEPCDVYTVTGLPRSDLHGMAYLPPALAEATLQSSILLRGRYRVPDPEHAFLTLAYHAVYHKGSASGLPLDAAAAPSGGVDHDYSAVLRRAAAEAGIGAEISLAGLDRCLAARQLRPRPDSLRRLAAVNPWVSSLLASEPRAVAPAGLAVFFVRDEGAAPAPLDAVTARLQAEGFTVLASLPLDEAARTRVRGAVRGGNWGAGPYPMSGGEPAVALVVVDGMPSAPDAATRARFPGLDNARLLVKEDIRRTFNDARPEHRRCNILHSSDSADEAVEYLRCTGADVDRLTARARDITRRCAPAPHAIRDLTRNGRRARVELVRRGGQLVVRKTFRPGCERYAERERRALARMQGCAGVPWLESADGLAVTTDYRRDTLGFDRRQLGLIPLRVAREAMRIGSEFHERGIALIDFTPANLLVERDGRVTVIDYEFAHDYVTRPARFDEGYDMLGPPAGFEGDLPHAPRGLGYVRTWQQHVGLTIDQLLHSPAWVQHLIRTRYRIVHVLPARARRSVGSVRHRTEDFARAALRRERNRRRVRV